MQAQGTKYEEPAKELLWKEFLSRHPETNKIPGKRLLIYKKIATDFSVPEYIFRHKNNHERKLIHEECGEIFRFNHWSEGLGAERILKVERPPNYRFEFSPVRQEMTEWEREKFEARVRRHNEGRQRWPSNSEDSCEDSDDYDDYWMPTP